MNNEQLADLVMERLLQKLEEKKDRCYKKAKATYDVFPSAYASGAIVRCRKGEIWKETSGEDDEKNLKNNKEEMMNETDDEQLNEKKRKLDKPSSEESLRDWFGRKGEKGSKGGWIDCNTCKKDKETGRKTCKACGREEGEKRSKYPRCRPTPSQCDGFKSKKSK
jgi:hypothetical protein